MKSKFGKVIIREVVIREIINLISTYFEKFLFWESLDLGNTYFGSFISMKNRKSGKSKFGEFLIR